MTQKKALTWTRLRSIKTRGKHIDSGDGAAKGLYAVVTPGKHGCSWVYRYRSPIEKVWVKVKGKGLVEVGKLRDMGLGPCKDVPLAEARKRAVEARLQVRDGIDPLDARMAQKRALMAAKASTMTFAACCDGYLAAHAATWRNDVHRKQWRSTLDRACGAFGELDVRAVDVAVVVKFLEPIWAATPETGSRLRGRIEKVLEWATAREYRDGDNPAEWKRLQHLLAKPPGGKHHSAMPHTELPAFMARLHSKRDSVSARALEFLILTAGRTSEVIGAQWSEIDLKAKTWTVPAERMKASKEHVVPLSDRVIKLLGAPGHGRVFPLSNMAMLQLLRGMDVNGYAVHGFRSTFRDWAGDCTHHVREVIEHALAHQLKDKAEAAYRRSDALEKRRKLMNDWARYCTAPALKPDDVVSLRRA
jgi:integrase